MSETSRLQAGALPGLRLLGNLHIFKVKLRGTSGYMGIVACCGFVWRIDTSKLFFWKASHSRWFLHRSIGEA
jgi:hypothetical protein